MSLIINTLITALLLWGPGPFPGSTFANPLWEDGKAEVCQYDAETVIYGKVRKHQITTIFVKEDFGTESKVKVDVSGSEKRVTAIKVHSVEKIESANYPYQRARTTIASRTDLSALLRQTTSSQEWCGITSARIVRSGDHFEHRWDSYFEGEPVGKEALPTDSITDHQLLLLARDFDFQEKKALEFTLLSGMESNKAGPLQRRAARMTSSKEVDFTSPLGTTHCRVVEVVCGDQLWMTLWVEVAQPHRIIGLDRFDGHKLRLRESKRWAYWQRVSR